MPILKSIYKLLTSYALASTVLILMTIVTLVGTVDQVDLGLFAAKKRYFHSWFTYYEIPMPFEMPNGLRGLPFPLPGGLLLMVVLFINMCFGALVHVRKRFRGIPMLIAHAGILFLLVSGFVTYKATRDGYVALYPGNATNRAQSYREWQIEILEIDDSGTPKQAIILPWEKLERIGDNGERVFTSPQLPFSVKVENFYRNARPLPTSAPISAEATGPEIDGFKLLRRNRETKEEANFPGCFATIVNPEDGSEAKKLILSGVSDRIQPDDQALAASFEFNDKQWGIQLVKKSWEIAFFIELDKFIFEKHPGTMKAKNFESRITRKSDLADNGKKVAIRMNEPMRDSGFVVFQESYGPPNAGPDEQYYSQFAVSDNPADQWPLYALIVTGVGLTLHFLWSLVEYISRSGRKRAAAVAAA